MSIPLSAIVTFDNGTVGTEGGSGTGGEVVRHNGVGETCAVGRANVRTLGDGRRE